MGSEMPELLPCPFCGSRNQELGASTEDREGTPMHVYCADCGSHGPWIYNDPRNLAPVHRQWNTRSTVSARAQIRREVVEELCQWIDTAWQVYGLMNLPPLVGSDEVRNWLAEQEAKDDDSTDLGATGVAAGGR